MDYFLILTGIYMNPLFKAALNESDAYFRQKENSKALKALTKASLFLPKATSGTGYLSDLIQIKDRSIRICAKDENPNYEAYLIFTLEAHALDILRDLSGFPYLTGFYYRKNIQFSPYRDDRNVSINMPPDEDDFMDIALKKLSLFKNRKEMFKEYMDFIYNELPIIYGIPANFKEGSLRRISPVKNHEKLQILKRLEYDLHKKNLSAIVFEIHDFIVKLLKKYHK